MKTSFLKRTLLWILVVLLSVTVVAQDNPQGLPAPEMVTIPGSLQSKVGCPGDWQPECDKTALTYNAETDVWEGTFAIPAGSYEYKVALNGSWTDNYGADGVKDGDNIALVLEADTSVTFTYDHKTGIVTDTINAGGGSAEQAPPAAEIPEIVNIPGTIQSKLGCPGDWQPECEATFLDYNAAYDVWSRTFDVPAGSYEYKVAINGSWAENYGGTADPGGANIGLTVAEDSSITFYYDHKTKWIADTVRQQIVTAPGTYQDEIGCEADNLATCMISWMQDIDGDGVYSFSTTAIPAGDYESQVAINGELTDVAAFSFNVPTDGTNVSFVYDSNLDAMVVVAGGAALSGANLREQRAYWVSADTLAWNVEPDAALSYRLLYSADASLSVSVFGLQGNFEALNLTMNDAGLSDDVKAKFPHLADFAAFTISADDMAKVPDILKGQFAIAAYNSSDTAVDLAGVQIPGVLDALYTYDGDLGVVFDANGIPAITVWAPTARAVNLLLFDDSAPGTDPQRLPMVNNATSGTWRIIGLPSWKNKFYLFEVEVFAPSVQQIVLNEVTDPYSMSLSVNSQRSQIVNLSDVTLKPEGWDTLGKPELNAPEDITIYELHIRDFSAFAADVPEDLRGTYLAFTLPESAGVKHLTALADAGLSHLHLLPSFDIATINENRRRWFDVDYAAFEGLPPDSEIPQAEINNIRDRDGFNWGYDPYHYNTPEGSYSTDPDGFQRIIEYRQMVMAINTMGLRVVQDVVYNHTNSSGQNDRSVLDRIVPGYYHRLDDRGVVARSTCCDNTATEHHMMRRLMVDSVVFYATQYKIDGFRFDLMGHHMLPDMLAVRAALDELTVEKDGVDGKAIYVYGEGWNFGEVADNARGIQASQLNIAGTGIGVFNDRHRDAVRGGNPFGDRLLQGLSNGLYSNPNGLDERSTELARLLLLTDHTIIGLAGNLRDYSFTDGSGAKVTGAEIDYNGSPAGYTLDPQENIIYNDKHDNESLYDNNAYKAPRDTTMADRIRMQVLGQSYVMYAQGIPFFQAGTDLLRSKSLDRNSYNSGDWFNRLDFTYQTNNFGVGLPPASDNSAEWETMRPLLNDPALVPTSDDIQLSAAMFQELLRVRYSSPLFRLQTGEQVMERLSFYNTGLKQMPGIIVMSISDTVGDDLDAAHAGIVVIFNSTPDSIEYAHADFAGSAYALHPVLAEGVDEAMKAAAFDAETGTFSVPALSAAVFVLPQA